MSKGSIEFAHNMAKLQTTPSAPETKGECENPALEAGKGSGEAMDPGNPGKGSGHNQSNVPTKGHSSYSKSSGSRRGY